MKREIRDDMQRLAILNGLQVCSMSMIHSLGISKSFHPKANPATVLGYERAGIYVLIPCDARITYTIMWRVWDRGMRCHGTSSWSRRLSGKRNRYLCYVYLYCLEHQFQYPK